VIMLDVRDRLFGYYLKIACSFVRNMPLVLVAIVG